MNAENVAKLPKWAQLRIAVLENKIRSLQSTLDEIGSGKSDTYIRDDLNSFGKRIYLPMGATVCFETATGTIQLRVYREREQDWGLVDVNAEHGLVVHPRASNAIMLGVAR